MCFPSSQELAAGDTELGLKRALLVAGGGRMQIYLAAMADLAVNRALGTVLFLCLALSALLCNA